MAEPDLKAIKEYIWAVYVDFTSAPTPIDEDEAVKVLEQHYSATPVSEDGETFYLPILLFETAENHPKKKKEMLASAKVLFERYRERTEERDWDALEDRVADIDDFLADLEEKEAAALLKRIEEKYAGYGGVAAAAEAAEEIPGMVLVPAGPFLSGANKQLRETGAFWIDSFPVTNEMYAAFCQATGYRHPRFWGEGRMREPRAPVVGVSWFDAYKYAAWAGKQLPTREQWEKAARGRTGKLYPWGEQIDHNKAIYGQADGADAIAEVGACPENVSEYGARDMVGNVWQWTDSWDREENEMKVLCGGSWCDPVEFLRLDQNIAANPKDKFDNIGFRCIRPE